MSGTIAPVNIAAAALLTQLGLTAIMFVGAALLLSRDPGRYYPPRHSELAWLILPFTLTALGGLAFSADFSTTWQPLFGNAELHLWSTSFAILYMFVSDLCCLVLLVRATGGSRNSPFQALYFVLPALAIFLREPFWRVAYYTGAVAILFLIQLSWVPRQAEDDWSMKAESSGYGVVSVMCVLLTTLVGYMTQPR